MLWRSNTRTILGFMVSMMMIQKNLEILLSYQSAKRAKNMRAMQSESATAEAHHVVRRVFTGC